MMPLELQVCAHCGAVQYPRREVCGDCLGSSLSERPVADTGRVLATTVLHASLDPEIRAALPWRLLSVRLDCGPVMMTGCLGPALEEGAPVRVVRMDDRKPAYWAVPLAAEGDDNDQ